MNSTHCAVRRFIIRGGNNEGWAEKHTGMQSSARLPSFPGEIDSGPRGALLSAASAEKVQRAVPISLSFSCPDTHWGGGAPLLPQPSWSSTHHPVGRVRADEWIITAATHPRPQRTRPCEPWVRPDSGPSHRSRYHCHQPAGEGPELPKTCVARKSYVHVSFSQIICCIFSSPLGHIWIHSPH